jgi:hypothetical protein
MTILLVDFSQMVISSVSVNLESVNNINIKDLVKHVALNQILGLRNKFKKSKVILCCDSRSYWRSAIYPHYKGHRKHAKDKSNIDFDLVYETLNELKAELKESFPYHVLEINGAEADDIIGVLSHYLQENELIINGLVEEPEEIVICSSDKDFKQLQKYKNVRQWNNVEKKFIVCPDPALYLIEHTCTGDTGDNIPNICTTEEWSRCRAENIKVRADSFKATTRLSVFFEKGINGCITELERKHYIRNDELVNFDKIPKHVYNSIINEYTSSKINGNHAKIFSYLTKHRMKLLIEHYQNF